MPAFFSTAFSDSTLIKKLDADLVVEDNDAAITALNAMDRGETLSPGQFPRRIWGDRHSKPMKRLPDLFYANGWWCVSQRALAILAAHDMGANQFSEVEILQRDRATPVAGRFFAINIVERKDTLEEAASNGLQRNPYSIMPVFNLPFVASPGDVAIRRIAADGADLWIEQRLQRAFLVSSPLAQALAQAGLEKAFQLLPCRAGE
ncbi:MAG: hypothetical protein KDJ66_07200 [Nitratireductor sp.]|nr:hypothetical protein [Nitratireductor sp.]